MKLFTIKGSELMSAITSHKQFLFGKRAKVYCRFQRYLLFRGIKGLGQFSIESFDLVNHYSNTLRTLYDNQIDNTSIENNFEFLLADENIFKIKFSKKENYSFSLGEKELVITMDNYGTQHYLKLAKDSRYELLNDYKEILESYLSTCDIQMPAAICHDFQCKNIENVGYFVTDRNHLDGMRIAVHEVDNVALITTNGHCFIDSAYKFSEGMYERAEVFSLHYKMLEKVAKILNNKKFDIFKIVQQQKVQNTEESDDTKKEEIERKILWRFKNNNECLTLKSQYNAREPDCQILTFLNAVKFMKNPANGKFTIKNISVKRIFEFLKTAKKDDSVEVQIKDNQIILKSHKNKENRQYESSFDINMLFKDNTIENRKLFALNCGYLQKILEICLAENPDDVFISIYGKIMVFAFNDYRIVLASIQLKD